MFPNGPQVTVNPALASPREACVAARLTRPVLPGRERMKPSPTPPRAASGNGLAGPLERAAPGMSDPGRSFELVSKWTGLCREPVFECNCVRMMGTGSGRRRPLAAGAGRAERGEALRPTGLPAPTTQHHLKE